MNKIELLITMTIIGVAAALVAPILSDLIPDKSKLRVLRVYNAISQATLTLMETPALYYPLPHPDEVYQTDCIGLGCTHPPLTDEFNKAPFTTENKKYGALLAYHLSTDHSTGMTFEMFDEI